jgi:rod shape-determining protein MreD
MTIAVIALLFLMAALDSTWGNAWQISGVSPDLLLVTVVSLGLSSGPAQGAMAGFLAGFLQGTMGGVNLGSYLVTRALSGFASGALRSTVSRANPLAPPLCAGVITLLSGMIFFLMSPHQGGGTSRLPLTPMAVLLNTAITPLIHLPLTWLLRRLQHEPAPPEPSGVPGLTQ